MLKQKCIPSYRRRPVRLAQAVAGSSWAVMRIVGTRILARASACCTPSPNYKHAQLIVRRVRVQVGDPEFHLRPFSIK